MWTRPSVPGLRVTKAPNEVVEATRPSTMSPAWVSLREQTDALDAAIAQLAVGGEHLDEAVLGHVDGALELGFHAADGLAALADDRADLLGVDADGGDARGEIGQFGPRRADGVGDAIEDEQPRLPGPGQGVAHDVERHARDLDVHLQGGDALVGAGDLEVHVAQVVLHPGDIGENHVVVALFDEAHGDAGHRAGDGHARVHQRKG